MAARGKRKPTLSQLDLDNTDDYEIMQSGSRDAGRGAFKPLAPPPPAPISAGAVSGKAPWCWCGREMHDWPGSKQGAPHPIAERVASPPPLGHTCVYVEVGTGLPGDEVRVCLICG